MKSPEYGVMAGVEDVHWWYQGLRSLVRRQLERQDSDARASGEARTIVDAGCGTGGTYRAVARPDDRYLGLDREAAALSLSRERGMTLLALADTNDLPVASGVADAVLSLDVIYFATIDPARALASMARVLKPGGVLLLNLPALQALRGQHDVAVGISRRFRRQEVRELLEQAGLVRSRVTYWNTTLLLPMLLWRLASRLGQSDAAESDLTVPTGWVNALLGGLLRLETAVAATIGLPIGSSVFAVAYKPGP